MENKIICMIPVRMGSKRIPKKNIRMLAGKPLVAYAIEAAKDAGIFDEIYLNSEDEFFAEIAKEYGIKFYKRPEELSADAIQNDDFMYDFLLNVPCHTVIQLLCTSPFINGGHIREFVQAMRFGGFETMISIKKIQIECMYGHGAINFHAWEKTKPSQSLEPVSAYACGLMGWNAYRFKRNFDQQSGAYHGGQNSSKGFFELSGNAVVDIDSEHDFMLAEAIFESLSRPAVKPQYYPYNKREGVIGSDADVPRILKQDGVVYNDLHDVNKEIVNIEDIVAGFEDLHNITSWSKRLINSESNSATLICQNEGEGNRLHRHDDWNEWWLIYQGIWKFIIEGEEKLVKAGDLVFIEKGKSHRIESMEDGSIRLAVSRADVKHVYLKENAMYKSVEEQKKTWATLAAAPEFNSEYSYGWGDPKSEAAVNVKGDVLGNYKRILEEYLLPNAIGKNILEIGSFDGKWVHLLKDANHIWCVDISAEAYEKINTINSDFYLTRGDELEGIRSNSIDLVYSMDSLVRSERPIIAAYLKEIKRVLKESGKACIHVACQEQKLSWELGFTQLDKRGIADMCFDAGILDFVIDSDSVKHGVLILINI